MSQISLQRSVFALNVLGLLFVSALYVAIHGFDRQIWHTLGWAGVAAIGTFAGSRWLRKLSGADVENPEDEDGSSYSQGVSNVVFWTPVVIFAMLTAAVAALESPLSSVAWMMIVVGGYVGRDAEALVRLRKQ